MAKKSKKTKDLDGVTAKDLKKLKTKRKANIAKISFDEHLAQLVKSFGVKEEKLLRVDQIFNGTWERDHNSTVDELIVLLPKISEHLMATWDRYGARPNVLTDDMFGHLVDFTDTIPVELAVMLQMQIWRQGFAVKNTPKGVKLRLIHKGNNHTQHDVSVWTKEEF